MSEASAPGSFEVIPRSIARSIEDTFSSMAGEKAEIEGVQTANSATEVGAGIISILGVKGVSLHGSLAIYFPEKTYVLLMNKVLGEEHTSICQENADGAAEILNIIYASARVAINEHGFGFEPAIPSSVRGAQLELPLGPKAKTLRMSCRCASGPFLVLVGLAPK